MYIENNKNREKSKSSKQREKRKWDVFISHASEDKESVARPIAESLRAKGFNVWYDEFTLKIGDNLRRSINEGLNKSRYGVVILSPNFFEKEWPQKELDGLAQREINEQKVILPVWHKVNKNDVEQYSPLLPNRLAISTDKDTEEVVSKLIEAMEIEPRSYGSKKEKFLTEEEKVDIVDFAKNYVRKGTPWKWIGHKEIKSSQLGLEKTRNIKSIIVRVKEEREEKDYHMYFNTKANKIEKIERKKERRITLQEFIRDKKTKYHKDKVLHIGYFIDVIEEKGYFTTQGVKKGYKKCRFKLPANLSDIISKLARKGFIMEVGEEKGEYLWRLTNTGIKNVEKAKI